MRGIVAAPAVQAHVADDECAQLREFCQDLCDFSDTYILGRDNENVGRVLIYAGLAFLVLGVLVTLGERLPIRLGRLPGDIVVRGKSTTFYFPIVTCLIVSLVLTLLSWLFSRR